MSGAEGWDGTERQPTAKKIELSRAESEQSAAKRKKDEDLERLNEKEPVTSSSRKASRARDKTPKQKKNGGQVRVRKSRKTKASQKVFNETMAEQVEVQEEQQEEEEVLDSDPLRSSPLPLPPRGHNSSSGEIM